MIANKPLAVELFKLREHARFNNLHLSEDFLSALLGDIPDKADWCRVYRYRTGVSANEASAEYIRRFTINQKIVV